MREQYEIIYFNIARRNMALPFIFLLLLIPFPYHFPPFPFQKKKIYNKKRTGLPRLSIFFFFPVLFSPLYRWMSIRSIPPMREQYEIMYLDISLRNMALPFIFLLLLSFFFPYPFLPKRKDNIRKEQVYPPHFLLFFSVLFFSLWRLRIFVLWSRPTWWIGGWELWRWRTLR